MRAVRGRRREGGWWRFCFGGRRSSWHALQFFWPQCHDLFFSVSSLTSADHREKLMIMEGCGAVHLFSPAAVNYIPTVAKQEGLWYSRSANPKKTAVILSLFTCLSLPLTSLDLNPVELWWHKVLLREYVYQGGEHPPDSWVIHLKSSMAFLFLLESSQFCYVLTVVDLNS